ncbi:PoNi-like cognate immunity protein [Caldimonas aquatica]|uniref:PoNi-like cognate immunity protein n=1 Tax=Caldimonas aquatica TaxID=376175 RepID=A0ABY6MSN0_9BURK|nr:PoNi-like cognate immunity protein [Schlegelella aquatica]UZD54993.1 PoNi-like cognate immunity protein [Schlegelella aquatica]
MEFHEIRRQQFLTQQYYLDQLKGFEEVLYGPEGLEENLRSPEREPGWHMSLARGAAYERFCRLLLRYTAGEAIEQLRLELEGVVAAYERYGELIWRETDDRNEVVFTFTFLDEYCELMQLIGLCFLLHRRDLLPRIAALQDGEGGTSNGGADVIYEEFMIHVFGAEKRFTTEHACQVRPYENLFYALTEDTPAKQLKELDLFLKRWYKDLAGTGWHDSHKPDENGNQGGYYGYWSFEAGAAVLLLGIEDDSSLHKYIYYPKDLVAWAREHAELSEQSPGGPTRLRCEAGQPCPREGWWFTPAKADSRRFFKQGEVMPAFGTDYGLTIWQWDERQDT